jgi:hypothetical protein
MTTLFLLGSFLAPIDCSKIPARYKIYTPHPFTLQSTGEKKRGLRTLSIRIVFLQLDSRVLKLIDATDPFFDLDVQRCSLSANQRPQAAMQCAVDHSKYKGRKYKEYHSVCPRVQIGTLPTLSLASECALPPPPPPNQRVGAHSHAGEGLGQSQFRRLEKSLALCLLSDSKNYVFCHIKARQDAKKCTIKKGLNNILKMLLIKIFF